MLPLSKHPSQRELECTKSHPTVADYNLPHLHKIIPPVRSPGIFFAELEKTKVRSICATNSDELPNSTKVCTPSVVTKENKRRFKRTNLSAKDSDHKGAIEGVEELEDQYLIQPYLC